MKKYIVTDPCYILPDEIWQKVCHECHDEDFYDGTFDKKITEELNKFAHTTDAVASTTGYGDWNNCMCCSNSNKVLHADFFADSGMVCVVEYNDPVIIGLINNENEKLIEHGGAAIIETEGKVKINMNTDNDSWTVVKIKDDKDSFNSLPSEYEEDEEDEDE